MRKTVSPASPKSNCKEGGPQNCPPIPFLGIPFANHFDIPRNLAHRLIVPNYPHESGSFLSRPESKTEKGTQMKPIHEKLCCIISDLNLFCETLRSLTKETGFATMPLPVDDYFRLLLASGKIQEAIGILEGMMRETQSVTSGTENGIK